MEKARRNSKIAQGLSACVMIVGMIVMCGWIFDISILKSILPMWVTMKFSTALCFLISGIIIISIAWMKKYPGFAQISLSMTTMLLMLFMASLFLSSFTGMRTGIEDLFVREVQGALKTITPGRPSLGTMVNFILISIAGIMAMFQSPQLKIFLMIIGRMVLMIGGIAVFGYVLNLPLLYYTFEGFSTAMACHTALLFMIVGSSLMLLGGKD